MGFKIDTFDKAINFYEALKMKKAIEKIAFIITCYPEILNLKQHEIAELLGLERETVNKCLQKLKRGENLKWLKL